MLIWFLVVLVFFATFVAVIATSFWPERVFRDSSLNWWRRAALTIAAFGWLWLAGSGIVETIAELPFFAALRPESSSIVSVYSVGRDFIRAIIVLLPWFLLPKLRKAIDLRVRWGWIALIFLIPIISSQPRSFAEIRGFDWEDFGLLFSCWMLIGVVEETVFRGYAFQLQPERRPKETIIVTSFIFSLVHLQRYLQDDGLIAWHFMANAFFCGIGLGVVRLSTGSVGSCIVIHGVLDIIFSTATPDILTVLAVAIPAAAALFLHPSCRRIEEPKAQALCGANT